MEVLRIIVEPTAAATVAGYNKMGGDELKVLVFDFGGSTFEVTILQIYNTLEAAHRGMIDIEAQRSDMILGGQNIDQKLVEYCLEQVQESTDEDEEAI